MTQLGQAAASMLATCKLHGIEIPKDLKQNYRAAQKVRNDWLSDRAALKSTITKLSTDKGLYVYHSMRDCDDCESEGVNLISANVLTVVANQKRMEECVEGPWRFYPIREEHAHKFEPTWRDLAAESMGY